MTTYEWLRHIPGFLLQFDETPLTGEAVPFPWKELQQGLSQVTNIKDIKIEPSDIQWRSANDYAQDISSPEILSFGISGMEGAVSWLLPKNDLIFLSSLLLTQEKEPLTTIDPEYLDGIHHFFALETLQLISDTYDSSLNIQIKEEKSLPEEAALSIDIRITVGARILAGRLLLSTAFRKAWAIRSSQQKKQQATGTDFLENIPVLVHLEAGNVVLGRKEWEGVNLGDFLILDHCSMDPTETKSRVTMKVNGTSIFRAKVKEGALKILELSTIEKVDKAMERTPDEEEEYNDLEEGSDEEFDFEEMDLEESEEEFSDKEEMQGISEREEKASAGPKVISKEATKAPAPQPFHPMDIPLSISVEVGRLQMSVKKLIELEPGNLLELDIKPENNVDLIVNGKLIATGELLKIGETLGVRILQKQ